MQGVAVAGHYLGFLGCSSRGLMEGVPSQNFWVRRQTVSPAAGAWLPGPRAPGRAAPRRTWRSGPGIESCGESFPNASFCTIPIIYNMGRVCIEMRTSCLLPINLPHNTSGISSLSVRTRHFSDSHKRTAHQVLNPPPFVAVRRGKVKRLSTKETVVSGIQRRATARRQQLKFTDCLFCEKSQN